MKCTRTPQREHFPRFLNHFMNERGGGRKRMMQRSITIRVEVLVVLAILICFILMAEFPFSISSLCPQPKIRSENCTPPAAASTATAKGQQQQPGVDQEKNYFDPVASSTPAPAPRGRPLKYTLPPRDSVPPPVQLPPPQQSAQAPPVAAAGLTFEQTLRSEVAQFNLLNSGLGGGGGGSKEQQQQRQTLEQRMEAEMGHIRTFIKDKNAQKALLDGAAAAAKEGHRAYSNFVQSLRNLATLARAAHVRDVSNFNFEESSSDASSSSSGGESTNISTTRSSSSRTLNTKQRGAPSRIEMFRFHTSSDDDLKLSVPSVPTRLHGLSIVAPTSFGLVAGFRPASSPSSSPEAEGGRKQPTLRVATLLTGHMRSYQRCAERLVKTVLEPTDARLFLATYPDRGEKRYGVREQLRDDGGGVDWAEVQQSYGPYLAGLFVGEVPLMRRRLELAFPNAFGNQQFSWMLYQFLLIEIGVNLTEAYCDGTWDLSAENIGEMSFGSWPRRAPSSSAAAGGGGKLLPGSEFFSAVRGTWSWGHLWKECGGSEGRDGACSVLRFMQQQRSTRKRPFDVFIRLRPDLFVVGTVKLHGFPFASSPTAAPTSSGAAVAEGGGGESAAPVAASSYESFEFQLACGGEARTARNRGTETAVAAFDPNVILVSPHHPRNLWYLDRTSDLSHIAAYGTAKRFLSLYSDLARLPLPHQNGVFVPLCTAERLWNMRAQKMQLLLNRSFGFFAMLRNRSTFAMSNQDGHKNPVKRAWIRSIFAIFDPDSIPCPPVNGTMATVPPPPPKGGKRRH